MTESPALRPPQNDAEIEQWGDHVHYAFAPHRSRERVRESLRRCPEQAMEEKQGLFVNDRMVSVCGLLEFSGRLRGGRIPIGGIGPVATPPEHRRRGYAREMLRALLGQMRERGIYTSALWPFYSRFYESLGWAVSAESNGFRLSSEDLRRVAGGTRPEGTFARVRDADVATLDEVYRDWSQQYDLTVGRSSRWWRARILSCWEGEADPYAYVYRDVDGEASAYVVYLIRGEREDRRILRVVDYAYRHLDGYRALLKFLFDHDSQVVGYRVNTPGTDPLWDWRATGEVRRHRGVMFRLVDLPAALEGLQYPPELCGTAVLQVRDGLCAQNDGRFAVSVVGGRAEVRPARGAADLRLGIGGLSQLYAGYRSVQRLVRADRARVCGAEGAELIARMFPPRDTFNNEDF